MEDKPSGHRVDLLFTMVQSNRHLAYHKTLYQGGHHAKMGSIGRCLALCVCMSHGGSDGAKLGKTPQTPGTTDSFPLQLLNIGSTAYIIEHSTVDPATKIMTTRTRNLSYSKLMLVVERQRIRPHPENTNEWTVADTKASVISNTAFASLRGRVEEFGVSKFKENCIRVSPESFVSCSRQTQ